MLDNEQYCLTADGWETIAHVLGEFCHGFNIEEIARNHDLLDEDDIKTLLLVLMEGYRRAYSGESDE